MNPMTLALLSQAGIAAGGTAVGALPDIFRSDYEKQQADELKKLKRQQELGALGLSAEERRSIDDRLRGRSDQSEAFAQAERARLTSGSPQFGRELLSEQIASEAAQRQQRDISQAILAADMQKRAEQEQQIRDLEAAQAEYKRRRQEALVAPFQAGAETAAQSMAVEKLLQLPPQRALPTMQAQYGLTPEEAAIFYGRSASPIMSNRAAQFAAFGFLGGIK